MTGLALEKTLVMSPFGADPNAGGPVGFIAQNLSSASGLVDVSPSDSTIKHALISKGLRGSGNTLFRARPDLDLGLGRRYHAESFRGFGADRYKYLWIHDVNVFGFYEHLIKPSQVVILQPHTPEPAWEELHGEGVWFDRARQAIRARAQRAFKRADAIVLPNAYCTEIYGSLINSQPVFFLPSASRDLSASANIPLEKGLTYFLYLGRRAAIKGFDLVTAAFGLAAKQRDDIRLLIVGGGVELEHDGIIDLGSSQRVGAWIRSCDCLVSANRQSYFDLSVMEALSAGVSIAYTQTGGHREFNRWRSPGLIAIERPEVSELFALFVGHHKSESNKAAIKAANTKLYKEEFSIATYHRRLQAVLGDIQRQVHPGA